MNISSAVSSAEKKAGKTILITGGAGFIGSNLAKKLIDEGHKVIVLDNFFTGKLENLSKLINNPDSSDKLKIINHDITEPFFDKIPEGIDEIYNLACPASPPKYQINPIFTIKTNTIGVLNVLEFARAKGAKILQASTSEIYGNPLVHPQTEKYLGNVSTLGPRACYDEGKRIAETLCVEFRKKYNLNVKIARIFNTYGPNMAADDGRVVSNFINQALQGENITIYGDGTQTRSFQYVDDLLAGFAALMNSDASFMGPVNLGNPQEFTVKEFAEKVIAKTNSKSRIIYMDGLTDDPLMRKPDIALAKEKLKWEPKILLDKGIDRTISYFRGEREDKANKRELRKLVEL